MAYEELILKTYELALEPSELQSFLDKWNEVASNSEEQLVGLDAHLERAADILDRISDQHDRDEETQVRPPGVECHADYNGKILHGTDAWRREHDQHQTLLELVPKWHHDDIKAALFEARSSKGGASQLVVCRNSRGQPDFLILIQAINPSLGGAPDRFRVRQLKSAWSNDLQRYFSEQYTLSSAELKLLELMVAGSSFPQIANLLGKSGETIKTQYKSIYSKLEVQGREEAIRLALHVQFLLPKQGAMLQSRTQVNTLDVLTVNGSRIGVTRKGAPDGTPFLLLHGMLNGYEFGVEFEQCLIANNLTAVCLDRPGYGRSDDPASSKTIQDEWIEKFPAILDALEIQECCMVSQTSGVSYIATALHHHPDRVGKGLARSSGMPNFDHKLGSGYPVTFQFLYWCLKKSPAAVRFYFAAHAAYLRKDENLVKLIRKTYGRCEPDREALQSEQTMACLKAGYGLVQRPGMTGLIGDLLSSWIETDRWQKILNTATDKTHLHYVWGDEDPLVDNQQFIEYCDQKSFHSYSIIERGGQLIQFTHPEKIVSRIAKMVSGDPDWCKA